MRFARLTAVMAMLLPGLSHADPLTPRPLDSGTLAALRWQARPLVVLGEGAQVEAQIAALMPAAGALRDRDVVLLTEGPGAAPLRAQGVAEGFAVLLVGKDGGIKLMRDSHVDPSEILALIDSMPMRQREAAP
ncbi:MAG: DUF4174 domain-containing protein [Paracoccus sp. (in: a-proteobacteria)]